MREASPLREEFRDRHREVVDRLVRIEDKIDDHKHGQYVPWSVLLPVLAAIGLGVFQIF